MAANPRLDCTTPVAHAEFQNLWRGGQLLYLFQKFFAYQDGRGGETL